MYQIIIRDPTEKEFSIFFVNIFLVIPQILIFPELISAEDTFIFQKKGVFAVVLLLVSFQSMCLDQATSGKYFCAIVARPAFARLCCICRLILVSSFYVYFREWIQSQRTFYTLCIALHLQPVYIVTHVSLQRFA